MVRTVAALVLILFMVSCGAPTRETAADSAMSAGVDEYHADNDIAMTVRSVVDAIRVGEAMDTTDYNFNGVLTDGQGRPIYSNMHGVPGKWDVDVISEHCVSIRNVDLGDLITDDLECYILSGIGLDDSCIVDSLSRKVLEGSDRKVYDFDGGLIQFEVHNATAPNGIEAPLILITATAYP